MALRLASHSLGDSPVDTPQQVGEPDLNLSRRVHLRQLVTAACIGFRYDLDPVTTHGFVFDRARGLTAQLRGVIGWIAEHRSLLQCFRGAAAPVWIPRNRAAKQSIRHDVVLELVRLGYVRLHDAVGMPLDLGEQAIAEYAELLQVA